MRTLGQFIGTAVNVWLWVSFGNTMSWLNGFIIGGMTLGVLGALFYKTFKT